MIFFMIKHNFSYDTFMRSIKVTQSHSQICLWISFDMNTILIHIKAY